MLTDVRQLDHCALKEASPALEQIASLLRPEEFHLRQPVAKGSVFTPYLTAFLMILQRLRGNATLEAAVAELKEQPAWAEFPALLTAHQLSSNSGGFSRARKRLNKEVVEAFADRVITTLQSALPPAWQGRQVFLLDGTTLALTSRDALRQAYPPASNQHGPSVWPIVLCVVAHELNSGCALRPVTGQMFGSKSDGEVALAIELLPRIPPGSVLMADRNFGVFGFVQAAFTQGYDTITRLTQSRFKALVRSARRVSASQWELDWKPSKTDRKTHPHLAADAQVRIQIHAIAARDVNDQEFTLWIATTLLVATSAQLAELYHARQNVELDIRDVKVPLKMSELRGRSADMVAKEIALGIVAYNLVVQIRRLAAARVGIAPRRLSFTGCWHYVNCLLLQPRLESVAAYVQQFERILEACSQRKLPQRPGRKYPRQSLPRRRKYPDRPRKPTPQ